MKRHHLLKFAFGLAAGVAVFAVAAKAAPLPPQQSLEALHVGGAQSAVVAKGDVDRLKPEQVRLEHRRHGHHGGHHGHRWHHHHGHYHHWHHHHWRHHHWRHHHRHHHHG